MATHDELIDQIIHSFEDGKFDSYGRAAYSHHDSESVVILLEENDFCMLTGETRKSEVPKRFTCLDELIHQDDRNLFLYDILSTRCFESSFFQFQNCQTR